MPPQLIPKSLELDKICRACLGEKGEMRPLYGSCLDKMLRCVAQVEVQAGDGLPELMCLQCVLQVSRAFRFKQQCETSDQTLRDFVAQTVQNANLQVPEVQHSEEVAVSNAPEATIEPVGTCALTLEDFGKEERLMVPQEAQLPTNKGEVAQPQFCDTAGIVLCEETVEIGGFPSETSTLHSVPELILTEDSTARTEIFDTFTYEDSRSNVKEDKDSPEGIDSHEAISFHCHVCNKMFPKRRMWRRHLKIHDPVKPHICDECGMSFTESSNLKKHQKKHTGELRNVIGKPNLCSVCGKGFKWASSLSKHMNHHTKKKILTCPHCPKYYVESRSLRIHLRTHTGEKPYICDVCDKGFTQMCNLEKHLRVHTGEKPYLCPVCGKGFSQSGYVAVHLRSHTGEKPYSCAECGKSFAGSNTLAIHKKIHTGEKPFACSVCKKSFGRQESLAIHLRTHTGEKSYMCSVCNRGFTCSSHLTIHFRTHTGEKPYVCKLCPKKFISCNSLKAHVKTHEKEKQESLASGEQNLQYADQQAENTIMILQEMGHDQIKNEFPILN